MYAPSDLRGLNAMVAAPATPDANRLDSTDTVDVDSLRDLINKLIADGVNVVSMMGSYGECHTLLWEEFQTLTKTAGETVNKRVPLFIGVTSLNSREVARKARFARDVGAEGIFTGVPFYYPPTVDNAIEFYHDMADYLPDLSIQIYHNPPLHNIHIPVSAFPKLVEKRQIVSMKDSHRSPLEFIRLNDVVEGKISVFVNQMQAFPFQGLGARGFWSTDVNMGPWPLLRLRDAVDDGDDETAKQILREIGGLGEGEWGGPQDNARKLAATAAGYANLGPNRPPFAVVRPDSLDKQMKRAAGWKALCEKYRPQVESRTLAAAGAR